MYYKQQKGRMHIFIYFMLYHNFFEIRSENVHDDFSKVLKR